MPDPRHARIRDIFLAASERPPSARAQFLSHECDDDLELRQEVEALLAHHDSASELPAGSDAQTRFRPGDLFADRYRIVSLLGEGGMGQVYRAEDETLGAPVAVKLLSEQSNQLRRRLLDEVRLAREITHPCICRVHDVGEWRGEIFITMEYVAGEDLSSLLRRIGRVPPDKVLEIARSLSAGLAAAHAQGVLHRDLKPANVLIDPDGRVRIADFGIAIGRRERSRGEAAAGTPAYMAPELFGAGRASERTDLYALGALLYELVTGRLPADEAAQIPGKRFVPRPPSHFVAGLDPRLERVIQRLLSPDPEDRPDSALAVASELPGGDPLALAAEVDVTPSPSLVASAGDGTLISRPSLIAAFSATIVLLFITLGLADLTLKERRQGWSKAPRVLAEDAERILTTFGHGITGDQSYGYMDDPAPAQWRGSILFWWTQSQERELPSPTRRYLHSRPLEPRAPVAGQSVMVLDLSGRLVYFQSDPPVGDAATAKVDTSSEGFSQPPWLKVPSAFGVTRAEPLSVEPAFLPPVIADQRRAWHAQSADGTSVRLEAAAVRGRIVYAALSPLDQDPESLSESLQALGNQASWVQIFLWLIILSAVPLALMNLRCGRGDRRGADRLMLFVSSIIVVGWCLQWGWPGHPMTELGQSLIERAVGLFVGGVWLWFGYLAIEPYVRRLWPRTLTAWSRVLAGRLADPLVGQSLVVGVPAGFAFSVLGYLDYWAPVALGMEGAVLPPAATGLKAVLGLRTALSAVALSLSPGILDGLLMVLIFVLCRRALGRTGRATVAFVLIFGAMVSLTGGGNLWISWWVQGLPAAALAAGLVARFGLLAYVASRVVFYLLEALPLTLQAGVWYAETVYFVLVILLAVAAFGLWRAAGPARRGVSHDGS